MSESILYILSSFIIANGVMLRLIFVVPSWLDEEVSKPFEKVLHFIPLSLNLYFWLSVI